ncbi:MAG: LuxR C-terminal-related transcriptional regulator, partial [Pseudomonadales bacterium]
KRTEGWPVALQTVRRWLSDGMSIDETLQQLSGRNSDLIDYFLEQVFESLPEDVQHFLVCTSILERVNGDIGGELCAATNGWSVLDTLTQKDLFVQALDLQKGWYRYHRLFTEFLRERLTRLGRQTLADLHQRAANWFMHNDYPAEALQHGMASQNFEFCAEILESLGGWHYALKGHVSLVQSVLEPLSETELQRFPRMWLAKIYLAVRLGKMELGEREIHRFQSHYLPTADLQGELMAEAQLMSATIDRYGDRPVTSESLKELETLGNHLPSDNKLLHAVRCNLLCALYRDLGHFEECMAVGDQAISHYREMGFVYTESFIYFHEGLACLRQARLRDAESLYSEGYNIALDMFGDESDLAAIGHAFLAEVCYEKNDLHDAKTHLVKAIPHIERADAWLDVYAAAYLTQMKLHWAQGETEELERTVARAKSVAVNRGLTRLHRIVDLQSAELALKDISWKQQAAATYIESGRQADVASDEIGRPIASRIIARTLLAESKFEEAIAYLEEKLKEAQAGQRVQFAVSLSILLAISLWLANRKERSIAVFESAVSTAIFEGNKRPFIDEGPLISGLIREISSGTENRRGNRLRDAFIAELSAELWSESAVGEQQDHVLSPREREVLTHVLKGRSNREIAEAIPLSVNTVKFHLKNVFEKLGVRSRKDAVSTAIRNRLV